MCVTCVKRPQNLYSFGVAVLLQEDCRAQPLMVPKGQPTESIVINDSMTIRFQRRAITPGV